MIDKIIFLFLFDEPLYLVRILCLVVKLFGQIIFWSSCAFSLFPYCYVCILKAVFQHTVIWYRILLQESVNKRPWATAVEEFAHFQQFLSHEKRILRNQIHPQNSYFPCYGSSYHLRVNIAVGDLVSFLDGSSSPHRHAESLLIIELNKIDEHGQFDKWEIKHHGSNHGDFVS